MVLNATGGDAPLTVDSAPDLGPEPTTETPDKPSRAVADPAPDLAVTSDDALDAAIRAASEPGRDAQGRFAAKDANTAKDATAPADKPATDAKPAATVAADPATKGWDPAFKAAFDALPEQTRGLISAHETRIRGELAAEHAPVAELANAMRPLGEALSQRADYLDRTASELGLTPHDLIGRVLDFEGRLRYGSMADKAASLRQMIRDYGVDPLSLIGDGSAAVDADPRDAELHDTRRELAALKHRLEQMDRRAGAAREQDIATQFDAFATAKDGSGQPSHPLAGVVRSQMLDLLKSGKATSLAEAYKAAAGPLEAEIAKRSQAADEAKRKADAAAVDRAKRTQPVRAATGSRSVSTQSLDDIIRGAMRA